MQFKMIRKNVDFCTVSSRILVQFSQKFTKYDIREMVFVNVGFV